MQLVTEQKYISTVSSKLGQAVHIAVSQNTVRVEHQIKSKHEAYNVSICRFETAQLPDKR